MKRFIYMVLLAVIGCASAFAGDEIYLKSGSVASLKDGGTGCVIIDMSDTKYDNKMPLRKDERYIGVDDYMPELKKEFVREFNDNSKNFKLTENDADAQYEFYVKFTNLDTFINVMSFKGGIGIKLWGSITIKNKATGEEVAVYDIVEEDNSGFTYMLALEEGCEGISKFLAKRIKKGK